MADAKRKSEGTEATGQCPGDVQQESASSSQRVFECS